MSVSNNIYTLFLFMTILSSLITQILSLGKLPFLYIIHFYWYYLVLHFGTINGGDLIFCQPGRKYQEKDQISEHPSIAGGNID